MTTGLVQMAPAAGFLAYRLLPLGAAFRVDHPSWHAWDYAHPGATVVVDGTTLVIDLGATTSMGSVLLDNVRVAGALAGTVALETAPTIYGTPTWTSRIAATAIPLDRPARRLRGLLTCNASCRYVRLTFSASPVEIGTIVAVPAAGFHQYTENAEWPLRDTLVDPSSGFARSGGSTEWNEDGRPFWELRLDSRVWSKAALAVDVPATYGAATTPILLWRNRRAAAVDGEAWLVRRVDDLDVGETFATVETSLVFREFGGDGGPPAEAPPLSLEPTTPPGGGSGGFGEGGFDESGFG